MTLLRPAANADAAQWLLRSDDQHVGRYGPPGFDAYARIAFTEEPMEDEDPVLRLALETLANHTATPDVAYAAVWEGWGAEPNPEAPRVSMPGREMLLFTGPVEILRDAPSLAWYGVASGFHEPDVVWPEDQSWCLTCDVDEEIEFSVGCSAEAFQDLFRALPGAVRRVAYGQEAPLWRDT